PPIIAITNPPDGAVLTAPASFQLAAQASDPDGTVASVVFIQGSKLLGNITNSPFAVPVSLPNPGDYGFSAIATDDGGLSTIAIIPVHVIAPTNSPPSILITNPLAGVVLTAPASFQLAAQAFDVDGIVVNVQFFQGSNALGSVANSPFAVPVSNLLAGDYSFSAVATDRNGLNATNTITIHVVESMVILASTCLFVPSSQF